MYAKQPKKLLILNILDILWKDSDQDHRLTQRETGEILRTRYGMTADRKAIKRNLIDLAARKLEICSVRTSAGSQVITKEPKTSSSRRTLHIPDILAEALIRQKKHQEDCKAYLEDAYVDSGYVFTYEDGRPMRPNYASELFTSFIAQNHLPPLTLHGLRHSFASIASAKGIPMYDIGKALGHSSPATTSKIYTHLLDPDHKDLLDRLWDES